VQNASSLEDVAGLFVEDGEVVVGLFDGLMLADVGGEDAVVLGESDGVVRG
jgi:hypothetical protein